MGVSVLHPYTILFAVSRDECHRSCFPSIRPNSLPLTLQPPPISIAAAARLFLTYYFKNNTIELVEEERGIVRHSRRAAIDDPAELEPLERNVET
jgi:hypothetical protein